MRRAGTQLSNIVTQRDHLPSGQTRRVNPLPISLRLQTKLQDFRFIPNLSCGDFTEIWQTLVSRVGNVGHRVVLCVLLPRTYANSDWPLFAL